MQISAEHMPRLHSQAHNHALNIAHEHLNRKDHNHCSGSHYNDENEKLEPNRDVVNNSSSGTSSDEEEDHAPKPDPNQVAGHMFSDGKKGNLATKKMIYKYCGDDPRALAEATFYQRISANPVRHY
eukprot:TRINITY_DN928_c0_g1_i1.p3 TRINITY_DN928_c0_g1~~TRINITY_DN928_c0_g1_i1.p3  ORF type:complete len:126 (-),score=33.07 TRINITY_DN928_c0_g1_i1:160-537(-)